MAAAPTPQAQAQALAEDRQRVLRRTVRALPQPMLVALQRGLERYGDQLVGGRLFKSRQAGGCAVGVMLLELDPELTRRGRLRFWLRDRWRRASGSYRPVAKNPRLKHLEWIFDSLADDLGAVEAGRVVRREAERELEWRSLSRAPGLLPDRSLAPARQ